MGYLLQPGNSDAIAFLVNLKSCLEWTLVQSYALHCDLVEPKRSDDVRVNASQTVAREFNAPSCAPDEWQVDCRSLQRCNEGFGSSGARVLDGGEGEAISAQRYSSC